MSVLQVRIGNEWVDIGSVEKVNGKIVKADELMNQANNALNEGKELWEWMNQ